MRIVATDGSCRRRSPACRRCSHRAKRPARRRADRGYAQSHTIYFCYAEPGNGGARTTLARARLVDEGTPRLDDVKVIFQQDGPLSNSRHFGCRIVQADDGNLFLSMGDHGNFPNEAQNLGNHIGKVVRIRPDGSAPPTIRSSAGRAPSPRSGATATAMRRASPAIR